MPRALATISSALLPYDGSPKSEEALFAATYLVEQEPVAEAILNAAEAHASDIIAIGGYGFNPLLEIVLGSTVDQVLRESRRLVLLCG